MHAIPQNEWGQVSVFTWAELSPHQWECFRLALMETETDLLVSGVTIATPGITENEVITELQHKGVSVLQTPIVFEIGTELITSIVVSTHDYLTDMMRYLPRYERKSKVFFAVLTSNDREFRNIEQQLEIVRRNLFIDTAIETLPIYERDLGIKTNASLSYKQRREQIVARNQASFDQTTEQTIKSIAAAYSNGDVEILTTTTPGVYKIRFIGNKGIPENIDGLMKAIDIVLPAHLQFDYSYLFNVWDFVSNRNWDDVSSLTWDQIKIWDGE